MAFQCPIQLIPSSHGKSAITSSAGLEKRQCPRLLLQMKLSSFRAQSVYSPVLAKPAWEARSCAPRRESTHMNRLVWSPSKRKKPSLVTRDCVFSGLGGTRRFFTITNHLPKLPRASDGVPNQFIISPDYTDRPLQSSTFP